MVIMTIFDVAQPVVHQTFLHRNKIKMNWRRCFDEEDGDNDEDDDGGDDDEEEGDDDDELDGDYDSFRCGATRLFCTETSLRRDDAAVRTHFVKRLFLPTWLKWHLSRNNIDRSKWDGSPPQMLANLKI